MISTYFIRTTDNQYGEPCNKAIIKLKKDTTTYYGGSQWGSHTPSDVVDYINADPDQTNFYSWALSLGYEIFIEEPLM